MARIRIKQANERIAKDFIEGGFEYKPIGNKYGKIGSRGGKYLASSASNTGKEIVNSSGVQKALQRIIPPGDETRRYVLKKLQEHTENRQNPHVSLKALDLLGKTEAMYTDKIDMQGKYMMGNFIIDLEDIPKKG